MKVTCFLLAAIVAGCCAYNMQYCGQVTCPYNYVCHRSYSSGIGGGSATSECVSQYFRCPTGYVQNNNNFKRCFGNGGGNGGNIGGGNGGNIGGGNGGMGGCSLGEQCCNGICMKGPALVTQGYYNNGPGGPYSAAEGDEEGKAPVAPVAAAAAAAVPAAVAADAAPENL